MKTFTIEEAQSMIEPAIRPVINRWLERGDGCAVYENHAMDGHGHGEKQFVSYGSKQCQLEVEEPPQRLPDIGGMINWKFQLIGTYRGEPLEESKTG